MDREGRLWCVDIPNGRILRLDQNGQFEVIIQYDGWPNGLAIHRDGRIFVADYKLGLLVLDPASRSLNPLLQRWKMEHFKGINDLTFALNGDLYFTDQGASGWQKPDGRLFRLRTNGQVDCVLDGIPSPNGLVVTPDGSTVFLAVTRANAIWRVPLLRDGSASKVGTFIQLSGGVGPDGLALDEQGQIAIAHVGLGCAWLFDRYGNPC